LYLKKILEADMRVRNLMVTLTVLMLSLGLISCDGGDGLFESGLDDSSSSTETPDDGQNEGPSTLTNRINKNVQTWQTPSTGQNKCYDGSSEIPCPEPGEDFFGQDGSYQYGLKDYFDNGDGTVLDLVTGLTWQVGFKTDVSWYGAENYCKTLTLNSDKWRIPDTHEIKSLVNYGTADPAIDTAAFPDTPSEWFWGARAVGFDNIGLGLESSWIINFYDGFVEYTSRDNLYNVRCVRVN